LPTSPEVENNAELAERLKEVRGPMLLLYAAQDDIIPTELALLVARSVPDSKLVLSRDHSHSLASEAPERLVQEVPVFMREVSGVRNPPAALM
jgi:pimeloyl-ACP methyl ester carboxylesterase